MSEWIKCSERLPEPNKNVIIWVDRYGYYPNYMDVSFIQDGVWTKHDGTWQRISHWQPMPEPPKDCSKTG